MRTTLGNFGRLLFMFACLRGLEAAANIVGVSIFGAAQRTFEGGSGTQALVSLLRASTYVLEYYYIAFGYLIFSALAFSLCWLAGAFASLPREQHRDQYAHCGRKQRSQLCDACAVLPLRRRRPCLSVPFHKFPLFWRSHVLGYRSCCSLSATS